jgi:helicase MOV-10
VRNILLGTSRPSPYIVFGPPGTGKTVTLVESIIQAKTRRTGSYILVCAPANAACDTLAQKLIQHCTTQELLRLYSSSRDWASVPEELRQYSNYRDGESYFPNEKRLAKYQIIVCTLIMSGRLVAMGSDHFTHVFIDECGQAVEPAALVPIAGVLRKAKDDELGGQVILAGDPMQLGPVCSSMEAEHFGLGISLLERLMKTWRRYSNENKKRRYNGLYITKLIRNFRSHQLILELPNRMFYDGELVSMCGEYVSKDTVKNLNKSDCDHAVVFHGVTGHERREGKSFSYFNQEEVRTVLNYVSILLRGEPSRAPVAESDIGILTPYTRQVQKLKTALKKNGWGHVEVGSAEAFQGREKRVIIISTVRSEQLGFVRDAKRFNVAVTRARSLLVVVGNPYLLESDRHWRELISLTYRIGSYQGCDYTPRHRSEFSNSTVRVHTGKRQVQQRRTKK